MQVQTVQQRNTGMPSGGSRHGGAAKRHERLAKDQRVGYCQPYVGETTIPTNAFGVLIWCE